MGSDSPKVYRQSTRSIPGLDCVQVAVKNDIASIRDSKNPKNGPLNLESKAFADFTNGIKEGKFQ